MLKLLARFEMRTIGTACLGLKCPLWFLAELCQGKQNKNDKKENAQVHLIFKMQLLLLIKNCFSVVCSQNENYQIIEFIYILIKNLSITTPIDMRPSCRYQLWLKKKQEQKFWATAFLKATRLCHELFTNSWAQAKTIITTNR